jgi:hypothetical protein
MASDIVLLLVVLSRASWLVAWWLARAFFHTLLMASAGFAPPVSILKPLNGLDADAYACPARFCQQDYLSFELLFGADDPAAGWDAGGSAHVAPLDGRWRQAQTSQATAKPAAWFIALAIRPGTWTSDAGTPYGWRALSMAARIWWQCSS